MVVFPNCKINIGLHVVGKREDGYHNVQTIFYPIAIKDALEIIDDHESTNPCTLSTSGTDVDGQQNSNICIKAYFLLKKDFPRLPSVKMHLHKNIPLGAGLGGGSADAAFTLQLLNEKYGLNITEEQLMDYALQLGSDCPFFLMNKPCYAEARGEKLEKIPLDLSYFKIILVNPGIHVNTRWAFTKITITENNADLKKLVTEPVVAWKESIHNDFEKPVFTCWPEIAGIKKEMYKKGALYSSLSGSGSSVFGIFEKTHNASFNFPAGYFCKWA